jgi:hypothetical protein
MRRRDRETEDGAKTDETTTPPRSLMSRFWEWLGHDATFGLLILALVGLSLFSVWRLGELVSDVRDLVERKRFVIQVDGRDVIIQEEPPAPAPAATVTQKATPRPAITVTARPSPTRKATPRPSPRPTRARSPSPSPSPSCLVLTLACS